MTTGENLNVFLNSKTVIFSIWDKNKEDGDVITLKHNDKPILSDFIVKNKPYQINVDLSSGENIFTIEALNEGSLSPNTAMIILESGRKIEFQSNLKKGEKATVRILQKMD